MATKKKWSAKINTNSTNPDKGASTQVHPQSQGSEEEYKEIPKEKQHESRHRESRINS